MMPKQKWKKKLADLLVSFPYPWLDSRRNKIFINQMAKSIDKLDRMKYRPNFEKSQIWRSYIGTSTFPDYSNTHEAHFPDSTTPISNVIEGVLQLFQGMPAWIHPQCMYNVVPPANSAGLIASTLTNIISPNLVEGEYAWNTARAEYETIAMVSGLIGWNPRASGGIFTFGGTGCYLYALKLALTHVLGLETRYSGIKGRGVMLVSKEGHYAKNTCADWVGIGMDNVIGIDVDENNAMCPVHLKKVMDECYKANTPVVMVVATMGTTDAFAIDPIRKIRQVINSCSTQNYPKPLLYADAVIGWAWLVFHDYDFLKNPLGFSPKALLSLEKSYRDLKDIKYADMVGIDFHKTGWTAYTSSLFVIKNKQMLTDLLSREKPAYISTKTSFNPFLFSLETSRSAASAVSAWATIKHFGYEGFRVLLGRIIEVKLFLKELIDKEHSLVCINPDNHGFSTLFRVYPAYIDAKSQFNKELRDPLYKDQLIVYNKLQLLVANKLFAMLLDKKQQIPGWENPPYTSYSEAFRPANYAFNEKSHEFWISGIKSFPMSPYSNELSMLVLRNYVLKARDLVIAELIFNQTNEKISKKRQKTSDPFEQWFGKDDAIPLKYLIDNNTTTTISVDSLHMPSPLLKSFTQPLRKKHIIDLLANIPYFYHLSESNLNELIKQSRIKRLAINTILCKEGDSAKYAYLILSGEISVYSDERVLGKIGAGKLVGEMALFEMGTRSANMKVSQDSILLEISGKKMIDFLT